MSHSYDKSIKAFPKITKDNYFEWRRHIETAYHSQCQDITTHGLLDLLKDDAEWFALSGTEDRPTRTLPEEPAGNASAASVALHNRTCTNIARG